MKMGAKFREIPTCNNRKFTHLFQDFFENKVTHFAISKSIIFDSWKDSITEGIDKALQS